jgi:MoxR-like ATPase
MTADQLRRAHAAVREVKMEDSLHDYLLDLVHATRDHEQLQLGVSPRGAITFFKAAQAFAFLSGRTYVVPDDIKYISIPVLAHRIVCKGMLQESQRARAQGVIRQILSKTPVPA